MVKLESLCQFITPKVWQLIVWNIHFVYIFFWKLIINWNLFLTRNTCHTYTMISDDIYTFTHILLKSHTHFCLTCNTCNTYTTIYTVFTHILLESNTPSFISHVALVILNITYTMIYTLFTYILLESHNQCFVQVTCVAS